ncbi:MAG: sulfatase [Verrucomicrobiae bacterium]|nr:sulfatase [Verrucomicrobiae bacterium]
MRLILICCLLSTVLAGAADSRPNILWFVVDDMSANLSCYGETAIETPHLDRLAAEGTRFTRAFVTAPVCSSSRSAMITGCYQTTIGAHHHRSGRRQHRIQLPEGVEPLPVLMQGAGYFTCIGSGLPGIDHRGLPLKQDRRGKTDYNFDWDESIYDSHDWAGRKEGQPFFMQVQLHGGKLRGDSEASFAALEKRAKEAFGAPVDPGKVTLPPYYPRDPVLLRDWAVYLDSVRLTDQHVGRVMERLREEGLLDHTLIIFMTDHGISHARGKQFLYDEGTHIPFLVSGPGIARGRVREDLIEHIDMAAMTLGAAGLAIPSWMQGRDILAKDYTPRGAVFAARDRCGEAADRIRSVRTDSHLYLRNFHPARPLLMPNDYKDSKAIVKRLRELHASGELPELPEELLFAPVRPAEELYEWKEDRWQTVNLAGDPSRSDVLHQLSTRLDEWIVDSHDPGEESPEVYDLEIADELSVIKPGSPRQKAFAENAETYRSWMSEGK